MSKLKKILLFITIIPTFSFACIHTSEILSLRGHSSPDLNDLILGNFYVSGESLNQWRIKSIEKEIKEKGSSAQLADDLAVAYEKIGNKKKAIAILEEQRLITPQRYETLANLGTFYTHDDEYAKGIALLDEALKYKPSATTTEDRFRGLVFYRQEDRQREVYQVDLAKYIVSKAPASTGDIKTVILTPLSTPNDNFYTFLKKKYKWSDADQDEFDNISNAIQGVSGMIRFGTSSSPILLEELGNLLDAKAKIQRSLDNGQGAYLNQELSRKAFIAASLKANDLSRDKYKSTYLIEDDWFSKRVVDEIKKYQQIRKTLWAQDEEYIKTSSMPDIISQQNASDFFEQHTSGLSSLKKSIEGHSINELVYKQSWERSNVLILGLLSIACALLVFYKKVKHLLGYLFWVNAAVVLALTLFGLYLFSFEKELTYSYFTSTMMTYLILFVPTLIYVAYIKYVFKRFSFLYNMKTKRPIIHRLFKYFLPYHVLGLLFFGLFMYKEIISLLFPVVFLASLINERISLKFHQYIEIFGPFIIIIVLLAHLFYTALMFELCARLYNKIKKVLFDSKDQLKD